MPRTPTLVNDRNGRRMVGNITIEEMIARVLMGDNAVEIARDAGIAPASISRVFRSETGVGMQKYKGLGRLVKDLKKTPDDDAFLLNLVERVKNGDMPRKILCDVGISLQI